MIADALTEVCGHCHKNKARKPAWGSRDKPICGECFMDVVQRGDPKLHDRIAEVIPGYEHRRREKGG